MGKRPTVLVLNGSEDLLDVLSELLRSEGLSPIAVRVPDIERGKADLAVLVKEHEPSLIIFDVSVPFGRSWACFQEISTHPAIVGRPCVLTTTNKEGAEEYTGPEVIELLLKPYDIDQFLRAVNRALGRAAPRRYVRIEAESRGDGSSNLNS